MLLKQKIMQFPVMLLDLKSFYRCHKFKQSFSPVTCIYSFLGMTQSSIYAKQTWLCKTTLQSLHKVLGVKHLLKQDICSNKNLKNPG